MNNSGEDELWYGEDEIWYDDESSTEYLTQESDSEESPIRLTAEMIARFGLGLEIRVG